MDNPKRVFGAHPEMLPLQSRRIGRVTTVVNFTNILRAAFAPIFFRQKITKPNHEQKKLCRRMELFRSTFISLTQKLHSMSKEKH